MSGLGYLTYRLGSLGHANRFGAWLNHGCLGRMEAAEIWLAGVRDAVRDRGGGSSERGGNAQRGGSLTGGSLTAGSLTADSSARSGSSAGLTPRSETRIQVDEDEWGSGMARDGGGSEDPEEAEPLNPNPVNPKRADSADPRSEPSAGIFSPTVTAQPSPTGSTRSVGSAQALSDCYLSEWWDPPPLRPSQPFNASR